MEKTAFDARYQEYLAAIEDYLNSLFAEKPHWADLYEAMRYSVLSGGKRLRPVMTLEFARLCGLDWHKAVPVGCALELVHTYSLIHDDLPCMDDDDLRRGKPSCHKKFDEPVALLAGDTLLTMAFEVLASNEYVSNRSIRLAVRELAKEAGGCGMAGGQTLDLANTVDSYRSLRQIHLQKTSALITAACMLGYYAATDRPQREDMDNIRLYAEAIGLAFQIHDDILDVKSDTATLGKEVGSDEKNHKKTVLSFLSIPEAEEEEALLTLLAVEAVSVYNESDTLCQLAIWLLSRKK